MVPSGQHGTKRVGTNYFNACMFTRDIQGGPISISFWGRAEQLLLPRRLKPQSGPISHPLKYQRLLGTFVIF